MRNAARTKQHCLHLIVPLEAALQPCCTHHNRHASACKRTHTRLSERRWPMSMVWKTPLSELFRRGLLVWEGTTAREQAMRACEEWAYHCTCVFVHCCGEEGAGMHLRLHGPSRSEGGSCTCCTMPHAAHQTLIRRQNAWLVQARFMRRQATEQNAPCITCNVANSPWYCRIVLSRLTSTVSIVTLSDLRNASNPSLSGAKIATCEGMRKSSMGGWVRERNGDGGGG